MKVHVLALFIALPLLSFSQIAKEAKPTSERSNIENFLSKSGSLVKKQFIDVGKVPRIEISVLIISDILANSKVSGIRFETAVSKSYGIVDKRCYLDADEVENFLTAAVYLMETAPTLGEEKGLEYIFTSRSGFESGAFTETKGGWGYFLKLDKYDSESIVFMKKEDFGKIIEIVREAKSRF